jgi:hypothetical protein
MLTFENINFAGSSSNMQQAQKGIVHNIFYSYIRDESASSLFIKTFSFLFLGFCNCNENKKIVQKSFLCSC